VSLENDVYTSVQALYAADTGAGGLNQSGATNQVRSNDFFPNDDPDWYQNKNYPAIMVECSISDEDDAFARGRAIVPFRLHLFVRRNTGGFSQLSTIASRIRTVFHRSALAAQSDWAFSPPAIRRTFPGPSTPDVMHRVFEFQTVATRTSGVA
jgi:hypothetical protein